MINSKKRFPPGHIATYELMLKNLHNSLMNDAHNKYLQSSLAIKEYVEKNLQDKVWDVKDSIHATTSNQQLILQGCLNPPTVDETAILLPSNDTITQKHMTYVLFYNKACKNLLSLNLIFLLFKVYYCQLQAA